MKYGYCFLTGIVSCWLTGALYAFPEMGGPTMNLATDPASTANNAATLMYFVPLVSPTLVDSVSSPDNQQCARILSFQRELNRKDFRVVCEFDLQGFGSHTSTYEPNALIEFWRPEVKAGKPMSNMLDYIKLEGSGYGSVEVTGRTVKGRREVSTVRVRFNRGGHKSPVAIGLYNIKPIDGRYDYANRSDQLIARVNTLTFRKTEPGTKPTMLVEVASVIGAEEKEGFWGNLKGALANLFIPPVIVDQDGNDAMLQFGAALVDGQQSFTFPKAKNLIVHSDPSVDQTQISAKVPSQQPEIGS